MSEVKTGAHPVRQDRNLGGIKYEGESAPLPPLRRKGVGGPVMTGEGFIEAFGLEDPVSQSTPHSQEAPVTLDQATRAITFKRGTPLFVVKRDADGKVKIPYTESEAENLLSGRLEFDQSLRIDESCLGMGKRGREVIKLVGRSNYGAFVVVRQTVRDRRGVEQEVERLASLNRRSLRKDNAKLKFKQATQ